tara:strand:- start:491 stop:1384 length:894 start_codon:yes stop_codon:yes gene_type:complete
MDQSNPNNDEINVIELLKVLRQNANKLVYIVIFFAISSVIYSFFQPEIWRSSTILEVSTKISGGGSSSGGGIQLAGIKLKDDKSDSSKALTLITSRDLVTKIIDNNQDVLGYLLAFDGYDSFRKKDNINSNKFDSENNIWIGEKPSFSSIYQAYLGTISVNLNKGNGFIYLSASHKSPIFAEKMLDIVIKELNDFARQRDLDEANKSLDYLYGKLDETFQDNVKLSISSLIEAQLKKQTLAKVKQDYLVEPLDSPFLPEERYSPNRRQILTYGILIGLILGIIYILMRYYLKKNKVL